MPCLLKNLLVGCQAKPPKITNWIFIMFGQSNGWEPANGVDLTGDNTTLVDAFAACQTARQSTCASDSDPDIVCTIETTWEDLKGQGGADTHGPNLAFGHSLPSKIRGDGHRVWLIHAAMPATSLYSDWDPAAVSGRMMYAKLQRFYAAQVALISNGGVIKFGGVVWIQGEADAASEVQANAYETKLTALVDAVEADFGAAPFVLSKLKYVTTYTSTVQAAQASVVTVRAHVSMAETSDIPLQVDLTHYTADGCATLGARLATNVLQYWGWF